MDRSLWTQSITPTSCPAWRCPVCRQGVTAIVPNSLLHHETIESVRSHNEEAFDFEWVQYAFTAWAECTQPACKQKFSIAGTGGVSPEATGDDGDWDYVDYFSPKFCFPMPDIVELPKRCPEDIASELRAAFAVYWINQPACAARIRVALEQVMNHLGVPKRKKTSNGKYVDLTLHGRIDAYTMKKPTIGAQLMALKWLGNTGSHDSKVSETELLDAFEIFEHVLDEIVGGRSARVTALAKKLAKKHGK